MGEIIYSGAIHRVEQAKIDAARITQKSGNARRGKESELQRFSASLGNRRKMDAAGKQIGAISENITRNLDAAAAGTLMSRVAAAEELGANIAQASAAGVGGSTIETYNRTLELNQAMQEEQQGRNVDSDNYLASAAKGGALYDAVSSFDNNAYVANRDDTVYVDHHKMSLIERVQGIGMVAAATYFGGPQAGAAAMDIVNAGQAAQNGDFSKASAQMDRGLEGAVNSYKQRKDEGGPPPGEKMWESVKNIVGSVKLK